MLPGARSSCEALYALAENAAVRPFSADLRPDRRIELTRYARRAASSPALLPAESVMEEASIAQDIAAEPSHWLGTTSGSRSSIALTRR